MKDGKAEDATRQPEQVRAFRDTWKLGIHSYLAYLRDRLVVARDLLTETGSVFVQIGDENVHLVRCVMDEVFGSENFYRHDHGSRRRRWLRTFVYRWSVITSSGTARTTKSRSTGSYTRTKEVGKAGAMSYNGVELPDGTRRTLTKLKSNPRKLASRIAALLTGNFTSASMGRDKRRRRGLWFRFEFEGKIYRPYERARWKTNEEGMRRLACRESGCRDATKALRYVRYFDDFPAFPLQPLDRCRQRCRTRSMSSRRHPRSSNAAS